MRTTIQDIEGQILGKKVGLLLGQTVVQAFPKIRANSPFGGFCEPARSLKALINWMWLQAHKEQGDQVPFETGEGIIERALRVHEERPAENGRGIMISS